MMKKVSTFIHNTTNTEKINNNKDRYFTVLVHAKVFKTHVFSLMLLTS